MAESAVVSHSSEPLICEDGGGKFAKTTTRVLTRRAVLWLGQTCNIRCHFCYFLDRIKTKEHPEHPFMDLEKAKEICRIARFHYGNQAIDIQGGEPTIYHDILALASYCREIGLYPTLITNGIALANKRKCADLKAAGVRDLLVSVQGIGQTYDAVVGAPGGHLKQAQALANLKEIGMPVRFNTVMSKLATPELPQIARLAVEQGARAVNFLAFNPFEDQALAGRRSAENVARYSDIAPHLNEALDILEEAGIEANVRYLPMCMVAPRHLKSMYHFQQLPFDLHEWDYASWNWTGQQPQRMKHGGLSRLPVLPIENYRALLKRVGEPGVIPSHLRRTADDGDTEAWKRHRDPALYYDNGRIRAEEHCSYVKKGACDSCALREICDGFHGDYAAIFGTREAQAVEGPTVTDRLHYVREQWKVVEPEDYGWAL